MQDELKAIQRRVGTTFVHVTHDQEEAMAIADRIVVMNGGRIEDQGPPRDVYLRPKTLFSAGFMGDVNRITVKGGVSRICCGWGRAGWWRRPSSARICGRWWNLWPRRGSR